MKSRLILLSLVTFMIGCNNAPIAANTSINRTEININNKNSVSDVIVVFKRDITIKNAKNIIDSYGMHTLNIYENISKITKKPILHIASNMPLKDTIEKLKRDKRVYSVKSNYKRELK